jgi:hypothetical protein
MTADLGEILKTLAEWAGEDHDSVCPKDGSPCRHARATIAIVELNNAAAEIAQESVKDGDPITGLLKILLKRHHPCRHGSALASCEVGEWMARNEKLLVGLRESKLR